MIFRFLISIAYSIADSAMFLSSTKRLMKWSYCMFQYLDTNLGFFLSAIKPRLDSNIYVDNMIPFWTTLVFSTPAMKISKHISPAWFLAWSMASNTWFLTLSALFELWSVESVLHSSTMSMMACSKFLSIDGYDEVAHLQPSCLTMSNMLGNLKLLFRLDDSDTL